MATKDQCRYCSKDQTAILLRAKAVASESMLERPSLPHLQQAYELGLGCIQCIVDARKEAS